MTPGTAVRRPKLIPRKAAKPAGSRRLTITWTATDSRNAQRQGWDLFTASGRYEIEHLDSSAAFVGDPEAVTHCIRSALGGDKTCVKALLVCSLLDPHWTAADYTYQTKNALVEVCDEDGRTINSHSAVVYDTHPSKQKIV